MPERHSELSPSVPTTPTHEARGARRDARTHSRLRRDVMAAGGRTPAGKNARQQAAGVDDRGQTDRPDHGVPRRPVVQRVPQAGGTGLGGDGRVGSVPPPPDRCRGAGQRLLVIMHARTRGIRSRPERSAARLSTATRPIRDGWPMIRGVYPGQPPSRPAEHPEGRGASSISLNREADTTLAAKIRRKATVAEATNRQPSGSPSNHDGGPSAATARPAASAAYPAPPGGTAQLPGHLDGQQHREQDPANRTSGRRRPVAGGQTCRRPCSGARSRPCRTATTTHPVRGSPSAVVPRLPRRTLLLPATGHQRSDEPATTTTRTPTITPRTTGSGRR
jgi:hypothetical protein